MKVFHMSQGMLALVLGVGIGLIGSLINPATAAHQECFARAFMPGMVKRAINDMHSQKSDQNCPERILKLLYADVDTAERGLPPYLVDQYIAEINKQSQAKRTERDFVPIQIVGLDRKTHGLFTRLDGATDVVDRSNEKGRMDLAINLDTKRVENYVNGYYQKTTLKTGSAIIGLDIAAQGEAFMFDERISSIVRKDASGGIDLQINIPKLRAYTW